MFTLVTITLRFLWCQNRTKPYRDLADIVRQPQGYRTIIVLSLTTSLYKSHDARTMTLWKSKGVGTLTVQLSCNYVHGFKRPPMFIFGFLLNCVSKSCDHKSCYEEASVLVEHGPKVWNSIYVCVYPSLDLPWKTLEIRG